MDTLGELNVTTEHPGKHAVRRPSGDSQKPPDCHRPWALGEDVGVCFQCTGAVLTLRLSQRLDVAMEHGGFGVQPTNVEEPSKEAYFCRKPSVPDAHRPRVWRVFSLKDPWIVFCAEVSHRTSEEANVWSSRKGDQQQAILDYCLFLHRTPRKPQSQEVGEGVGERPANREVSDDTVRVEGWEDVS